MKMYVLPLLAVAVALISGCEGSRARLGEEGFKQEMARQAQASLTRLEAANTRTYTGKPVQEVVAAARKVLVLWDNPRLTITDTANGFTAVRKAPWYAPTIYQQGRTELGFRAVADGNGGVKASLNATTYIIMGSGAVVNGAYYGTMTSGVTRDDGLASYALFWRRMDYLLGLSKTWTTCEAFDAERENIPDLSKGSLRPLCASFIQDARP